ncbi:ATP-binding protein [Gloeothece verrucosa]|uniref:Uncharacterized AAA domain-containing protein ycf46 n=1 Tax=Gloeothece verrucosa (strain PCC 7822) TaxID=497965 RepID=E0UND0_GLOV7|nr:AAA family ATPase [Gloeothece verrucosa]ADN18460.1 AAA ATPase central domain protein [Gloeothece verrucosa PCC 7822]
MQKEIINNLRCFRGAYLSFPALERSKVKQEFLQQLSSDLKIPVYYWNLATKDLTDNGDYKQELTTLQDLFESLQNNFTEGIFCLENIGALLHDEIKTKREVLTTFLLDTLDNFKLFEKKYLILLDVEELELPTHLNSLLPSVIYPLPTISQIQDILQNFFKRNGITLEISDRLINSVSGLSAAEIEVGCQLALSSPDFGDGLYQYKIKRLQGLGLEFLPLPDVSDFGGLDRLKLGIEQVALDYSYKAREYNLPLPKGWLLAGPPGTGKTFAAKVVARRLGFPLISVGVDLVKSKGAAYLKRILQRIEAAAPAVCYFDEFDKFFDPEAALTGSGSTKEVLGVLLTWLQEKQTKVFAIATLNRLDALPPELTRAGRFDKIFYVGFPQAIERKQIFQLHAGRFDERYLVADGPLTEREWRLLLSESQYCTGAEIRAIVEMAAKNRFYNNSPINLELNDLIAMRRVLTPLYVRDTERVLAMENRARFVAESASSPDNSVFAPKNWDLWGDEEN